MNPQKFSKFGLILFSGTFFLAGCTQNSEESFAVLYASETMIEDLAINAEITGMTSYLEKLRQPNGLLIEYPLGKRVSLYDNALAVILFSQTGEFEYAKDILSFFQERIEAELTEGSGGFHQFRDAKGNPIIDAGLRPLSENAWLLIATRIYHETRGDTVFMPMERELTSWIRNLQDNTGALWGGNRGDEMVPRVTDGMLDAFYAVPGFDNFHRELLGFLERYRWDERNRIFLTDNKGTTYQYALDLIPRGFCMLEGYNSEALKEADVLATRQKATINGKTIKGFGIDLDKDIVWLEGTALMVVALERAKKFEAASRYREEIRKVVIKKYGAHDYYGIPYVTNQGTLFGDEETWVGADIRPAISTTIWYLFGVRQIDPFAILPSKDLPEKYRFWQE